MHHRGRPPKGEAWTPPVEDPHWEEWSEPVRQFLRTPRSWPELKEWHKGVMGPARLRHCLAWLESERKAYYDDVLKLWTSSPLVALPEHLADVSIGHEPEQEPTPTGADGGEPWPEDEEQDGADEAPED